MGHVRCALLEAADSCDHTVQCQSMTLPFVLLNHTSVLTSGTANACGWICAEVGSSERQFWAERNLVSSKVTFFFRTWMQIPIDLGFTDFVFGSFDHETAATSSLHVCLLITLSSMGLALSRPTPCQHSPHIHPRRAEASSPASQGSHHARCACQTSANSPRCVGCWPCCGQSH